MSGTSRLFVGISENLSHEFPDLPVIRPINLPNHLPAIGRPYDATIILLDGSLSWQDVAWFRRLERTLNPFFVTTIEEARKVVEVFHDPSGQE